MLAKIRSFALVGIDAVAVEVEVDAAAGLPKTVLVGLPEMAVKESIHRIERAMANLGYQRPNGRTVRSAAPPCLLARTESLARRSLGVYHPRCLRRLEQAGRRRQGSGRLSASHAGRPDHSAWDVERF